ncbi:hypothetical protein CCHL11_09588 [Colletotrichum chlorophyti]|uniref:Uncharacterized protein n=1 Tax=Colletotrichum chlorophyti TaxID=708187 RepID=A0A1Q8RSQ5_9PEZI|nr:hypothetical protein CCHL11_09588 [Colletotrichum chlorophyti]
MLPLISFTPLYISTLLTYIFALSINNPLLYLNYFNLSYIK